MATRLTATPLTRWLTAIICFLCVHAASAEVKPYTAIYDVQQHYSDIARATQQLRLVRDHMHFTQTTELVGFVALFRDDSLHEDSEIRIDDTSWRLKHYELRQTGSGKRRDMHFDVEWSNTGQQPRSAAIKGTWVGDEFDAEVAGEVWDPLSVVLALQRDEHRRHDDFSYKVISSGEQDLYVFERRDGVRLEIDETEHECVQFTRTSGRRETRIYLSKRNNLVPVRIEQYKDGDLSTRMTLNSLQM